MTLNFGSKYYDGLAIDIFIWIQCNFSFDYWFGQLLLQILCKEERLSAEQKSNYRRLLELVAAGLRSLPASSGEIIYQLFSVLNVENFLLIYFKWSPGIPPRDVFSNRLIYQPREENYSSGRPIEICFPRLHCRLCNWRLASMTNAGLFSTPALQVVQLMSRQHD